MVPKNAIPTVGHSTEAAITVIRIIFWLANLRPKYVIALADVTLSII